VSMMQTRPLGIDEEDARPRRAADGGGGRQEVEDGEAGEDLREGPAGGAELARQRRMPAAKKRMRRPKLPWCGRESGLDGACEG
jgi:hypothetical protein